jgi:hypothetical protein
MAIRRQGGAPSPGRSLSMSENAESSWRTPRTWVHLALLAIILFAIAWLGIRWKPRDPSLVWVAILVLMTAFAVVAGHGITGYWRGVLVDGRYKMSLSRLQMLVWSLLVLSAILAAAMVNLSLGSKEPLDIVVPGELFVLFGISTASLVASPAILSNKREKKADPEQMAKVKKRLADQGHTHMAAEVDSVVLHNDDPLGARWSDLLKGDEVGNATTVDLGKFQMFFFTFILALAYGSKLYQIFHSETAVTALPGMGEGINTLLGISHTGYLSSKVVSASREKPLAEAVRSSSSDHL